MFRFGDEIDDILGLRVLSVKGKKVETLSRSSMQPQKTSTSKNIVKPKPSAVLKSTPQKVESVSEVATKVVVKQCTPPKTAKQTPQKPKKDPPQKRQPDKPTGSSSSKRSKCCTLTMFYVGLSNSFRMSF